MFDVITEIDWLAVVAATVTAAVLAGLYFALLVPSYYAIALGRVGEPAPEQSLVSGLGPVVCILVTTITSAILLRALEVTTTGDAAVFGAIVGIGYLSAMTFQIAINPNFPRPLLYGVVNAPYFVVSSVLGCVVLQTLG